MTSLDIHSKPCPISVKHVKLTLAQAVQWNIIRWHQESLDVLGYSTLDTTAQGTQTLACVQAACVVHGSPCLIHSLLDVFSAACVMFLMGLHLRTLSIPRCLSTLWRDCMVWETFAPDLVGVALGQPFPALVSTSDLAFCHFSIKDFGYFFPGNSHL